MLSIHAFASWSVVGNTNSEIRTGFLVNVLVVLLAIILAVLLIDSVVSVGCLENWGMNMNRHPFKDSVIGPLMPIYFLAISLMIPAPLLKFLKEPFGQTR